MENLSYQSEGGVGTLTINRPKAMNALNSDVLNELSGFFSDLPGDLRALIITGSGDKAFVAGADIKELDGLDYAGAMHFAEKGQSVFRQIEKCRVPVVAAVNGFALGGGLELALSCDFMIASTNAQVGLPEVSLGIMPGFGGTVRLARLVGLNRARQLIFTGEFLTAERAESWGIVNQVVAQDELIGVASKVAGKMARLAPLAIAKMKESTQVSFDQDVDSALKTEAQAFSELFGSADQKEGTQAFIEKRKPVFSGT